MKNNDPSHDWFHVERVYKNAMHLYDSEAPELIAKGANLDLLVIQIAALFHDIADFKYEYNSTMEPAEILEERLGDFFLQFENECTKEQKKEIFFIILNISWRKELEMTGSFLFFFITSTYIKKSFSFVLERFIKL